MKNKNILRYLIKTTKTKFIEICLIGHKKHDFIFIYYIGLYRVLASEPFILV